MRLFYQRGGIRLFHGDCLELESPGIGCVITSPPYNCGMDYGTHDDRMPIREYLDWLEHRLHVLATLMDGGAYFALNIPNWIGSRDDRVYALDEIKPLMERHYRFHDMIVWAKGPPNGTAWGNYPTTPMVRANHEWVMVFRNGESNKKPRDISWEDWSRLTQSVWQIQPTLPLSAKHPATFPIDLPAKLIRLYSATDDVICDPFAGTCTTGIAAWHAGRPAVLVEVDEEYCEIGAARLDAEISQGRFFPKDAAVETQAQLFSETP